MRKQVHLKIIIATALLLTIVFGVKTFAWHPLGCQGLNCEPDGDMGGAKIAAQNRTGITHAQYPDGLDFPSFNNYTDNRLPFWASDERRFFAVRKSTDQKIPSPFNPNQTDYAYQDSLQVQPGDILRFAAYIHNDADQNHNPDDGSTRSLADKVRVRAEPFAIAPDLGQTAIATAAGTQFTIKNFISSSTTTKDVIDDPVTITSQVPVRLQFLEKAYDDNTVSGVEFVPMADGVRYPLNQYDFFGALGASIGSPIIGSGSYFGSESYRAKVYFDVKVIPVPIKCESIQVNRDTFEVKPGVNSVDFSITQVNPANFPGSFTWTANGGGQINQTPDGRSATLLNPQPGVSVSVAPTDITENAPDCRKQIPSTTPELCKSISMTPRTFNPNGAGSVVFDLTVDPPNYQGNFVWQTDRGNLATGRSATFQLPTDAREVRVFDQNSQCQDRITVNVQNVQCDRVELFPTTFIAGDSRTFTAQVFPQNFVGSLTLRHVRNGAVVDERITNSAFLSATFNNLSSGSLVTAQATPANSSSCVKNAVPEQIVIPPPTTQPAGNISKTARAVKAGGGNTLKLNDTAEFVVAFTPRGTARIPELVIRDTAVTSNLTIRGSDGGIITVDPASLQIQFRKAGQGVRNMLTCDNSINPPSPCYENGSTPFGKLIVHNLNYDEVLLVTYRGKLTKTPVNASFCKNSRRTFCGEQFTNIATYAFNRNAGPLGEARADLFVPCPFLLARGLGDVVLRRDLSVGADIQQCFGIPNIEPPTITPPPPPPPGIPKTGAQVLNVPRHELCQQSNRSSTGSGDSRPDAYKNPLASVSSAVCEVSMTLADILEPPQIRDDVLTNIIRLTRNNYVLTSGDIFNINGPSTLPNPNISEEYNIYKLSKGDLTIHGSQEITEGARTYVIEHGNLVITGDLTYKDMPFDLKSLKSVPSIAFIVLDGDIIVSPEVSQLSGIFVTLNGKVRSAGNVDSEKSLKINGSIYGDIEPLFENRGYTGNARTGEGTISIDYDGRLYYNLPPGLQEVLDIKQEQVAR